MNKVIILRKIQVTMKTFSPPFFNHFRMALNRKKTYGNERSNEGHEKETKHDQVSAADLLHIRIENLDSCKCRHCKNESREIDCLFC